MFINRIGKHIVNDEFNLEKTTYYVLDATGNVMATYDKEIDYINSKVYLKLKDRSIYGSSRVGVRSSDIDMFALHNPNYSMKSVKYEIGKRTYELSNHLGNVLSVISDKPIPSFEHEELAGMLADVRVAQDYSSFGVTLSGRSFEVDGGYRYGFGGQEKDDEVSGKGNSYTAEFWQYDSRLGRRWNIDPVVKHHESPYATFANNPIWFRDPNGADTLDFNETGDIIGIKTSDTDVFRVFDAEKNVKNNLSLDKKVIQYKWETTYRNSEKNVDVKNDILQISGNKDAERIFKFLAENTNVEWGFYATMRGTSENGFISTSHDPGSESGSSDLYNKKLGVENYNIIKHMHNHPSNNGIPSGSFTIPEFEFTPARIKGDYGDVLFAKTVQTGQSKRQSKTVLFQIYLPKTKKTVNYDQNSSRRDF